MIIDRLENIEKYASLNPLFAQAVERFAEPAVRASRRVPQVT